MPMARKTMLPRPTAPMAAGPSGPTISVSTSPISVHPISARMTGTARAIMGLSSRRMPDNIDGIISQQGLGQGLGQGLRQLPGSGTTSP